MLRGILLFLLRPPPYWTLHALSVLQGILNSFSHITELASFRKTRFLPNHIQDLVEISHALSSFHTPYLWIFLCSDDLTIFSSYCWFSVLRHIKIKIKAVQKIKSRIWKKEVGKYAKTLTKIQDIQITASFLKRDMRRNVVPKFIEICMETPCCCPSTWVQHGGRKSTKTSVTEFCGKSVNLSLEELKNNKLILFLTHELFRWPNSPK